MLSGTGVVSDLNVLVRPQAEKLEVLSVVVTLFLSDGLLSVMLFWNAVQFSRYCPITKNEQGMPQDAKLTGGSTIPRAQILKRNHSL